MKLNRKAGILGLAIVFAAFLIGACGSAPDEPVAPPAPATAPAPAPAPATAPA